MPDADVTTLLRRVREDDAQAFDRLVPVVYDQLRALARGQRRRQGASETVNTTALVHEAYARLADRDAAWADRQHFLRVAARAMRDVLVDYARSQRALKRGGPLPDRSLSDPALEEALGALPPLRVEEILDARRGARPAGGARRPSRRGSSSSATSRGSRSPRPPRSLAMSPATAARRWTVARAWLYRELTG